LRQEKVNSKNWKNGTLLLHVELLGSWDLSIASYLKRRTRHYGNWICFPSQVKEQGGINSVMSDRQSHSQSVIYLSDGSKWDGVFYPFTYGNRWLFRKVGFFQSETKNEDQKPSTPKQFNPY
jgi:hypothetical protein